MEAVLCKGDGFFCIFVPMRTTYQLITILGPTASGKTPFAAVLADRLDTEIISADSRQIYRGMDIGTGKDLADYTVNGKLIPYHLIDICDPGYKYNVFEYQHDFFRAYQAIQGKGKLPILCGGTGMYIEAVLKGYKLLDVPQNPELRESLKINRWLNWKRCWQLTRCCTTRRMSIRHRGRSVPSRLKNITKHRLRMRTSMIR